MSRSYSSATNSDFMKHSNRRLLINIIRRKPVSRAELARLTGLTRAAVTIIVSKLIEEGILAETGSAEARFGRKPVLLDLEPSAYYSVGVSITRDGCDVGIMDFKGALLTRSKVELPPDADAGEMIDKIADNIRNSLESLSLPYERILGIGINTPGPVDAAKGKILHPPNFDRWHDVEIVREFGQRLDFPAFLENNSISLAIAEKNHGKGSDFGSFMLIVVDSGIGAGIIINENVYRGVNGSGSEVGHTSIDFGGELCRCGNKGCLELYASIPSVIRELRSQGITVNSWKEIADKAIAGDSKCVEAVEREAMYLSAVIINMMNVLDLEAVVLTGDIGYKPDMLLEAVRANVWRSGITRDLYKLIIICSSITEDPGIISAASIIFERFFRGEI